MRRSLWTFGIALLAALAAAAPARAQDVHQQMKQVTDLSRQMLGVSPLYGTPFNPCPDPCPCAQKCSCGSDCTCQNLGGTPNQKLLGRVWYWGWTLRNLPATSPTRACARQYVLDTLALFQTHGHYSTAWPNDEALTISHGQLYLAGMAAAYLFALTNGPTFGIGNPPDTQVLDAVRQWWADEKYSWDQIANGSGKIRAPGARFLGWPNEGEWLYREAVYTLLNGGVPNMSGWGNDKYYLGGWIINELRVRNPPVSQIFTPPAGYSVGVRLHDTLCLYRLAGGDFLHYFPRLIASNPIFWVKKTGTSYTFSQFPMTCGSVSNGIPPVCAKPDNLPAVTPVLQFLGRDPASIACPPPQSLHQ
jgi:hypothetical protein